MDAGQPGMELEADARSRKLSKKRSSALVGPQKSPWGSAATEPPSKSPNPEPGLRTRAGYLGRNRRERFPSRQFWVKPDRLPGSNLPRIVAALSFGFWISLLGRSSRTGAGHKANYEMTLWRPALRGAFSYRASLTRSQVHRPLNTLRILRNQIAHHEPIFTREPTADHERILEVARWISPEARNWIEHHSRVPAMIEVV